MSHVPLQVVPSLFKPYPGSQSQRKEPGVLTHTCRQLLVLDVAHSSLSGGDNKDKYMHNNYHKLLKGIIIMTHYVFLTDEMANFKYDNQ